MCYHYQSIYLGDLAPGPVRVQSKWGLHWFLKHLILCEGGEHQPFFLKGGLRPRGQSGEFGILMGDVSDVSTMDVMPRACPIPGEKAAF